MMIANPTFNSHLNDGCYFTLVVLIRRPSGERGFRNSQNRYLRSSYCCSVYPAVHNSYRALLRSSSIREPSDPPLRVIKLLFKAGRQTFSTFSKFHKRKQETTNKLKEGRWPKYSVAEQPKVQRIITSHKSIGQMTASS